MKPDVTSAQDILTSMMPFVEEARKVLPVPMLQMYANWLRGGNPADVAAALRAVCQTQVGTILLPHGPVTKLPYSPDQRRPQNTTYLVVRTFTDDFVLTVKNTRKVAEGRYKFLTEAAPELSGSPSERLIEVPVDPQPLDIVLAIERTKETPKRPASLSAKLLIGMIDHRRSEMLVEREAPIFMDTISQTAIASPRTSPDVAVIEVPISSRVTRSEDTGL